MKRIWTLLKDNLLLISGNVNDFYEFSGSIFLAKAVAPNEIIHVSARDINSVFKVQANSGKRKLEAPIDESKVCLNCKD